MKVVSKFAIAFFLASVVCLAVFTVVLSNREASRLEKATMTGLASYATGLRGALEMTWRESGYDAAARIVAAFEPSGEVRARLERASSAAGTTAADGVVVERADGRATVRLRTTVAGPAGERASLSLERTIADSAAIRRDELDDELVAALALAVVMAGLAAGLGAVVIGRPLGRIVAQARRIGEGDFSRRLRATGTDEIGVLKRELNAMCDRLVTANARLDEEATARIETLERLRHLDRLRTVGTIASGIAHELGTPLNVLLMRGHSLARGELAADELEDAGKTVVSQVEKMARIVRQLLAFSRTRSAQGPAAAEVDLAEVARHACALLTSMAKKNGVTLTVHEGARVTTQGDFRHLEQALTNLIVNGIQAMPGGGRLEVRVGPADAKGKALVEVTDDGEGMTEEIRSKVFEPFFTTKPDGEGTGLGLHVARGIVEELGGTISVRSAVGQGTTFSIELPRCS